MKKINKNNVFVMRNFDGVYTSGCDSPFTDRRGRERGGGGLSLRHTCRENSNTTMHKLR